MNAKACGMTFFCTDVAEPDGDLSLLEQCMSSVNIECPDIGKMLFSAGVDKLAVLAYVPDALAGEGAGKVTCEQWLQEVARSIGGEVLEKTGSCVSLVVRAGANTYPIKLKEPGITAAICFLKGRGLFPVEEDEDDFIYGDDDFPMG